MTTMTRLISEWIQLREQIRTFDEQEHPPITARFGRVWVWRSGDFYAHDDTLCFPRKWILGENGHRPINLPSAQLADNPNYSGLCAVCRQEWPIPFPTTSEEN